MPSYLRDNPDLNDDLQRAIVHSSSSRQLARVQAPRAAALAEPAERMAAE